MSFVTVLIGASFGAGILLVASPWLWPAGSRAAIAPQHNSAFRGVLNRAGFERVGIPVFVAVSICVGLIAGALTQALVGVLVVGCIAALVTAALPAVVVQTRARARAKVARSNWPDAVDQLVSAVRSGMSLPDAVSSLASTGPKSTRAAFALFDGDFRATGNFALALDALKHRLSDPLADRILEILRMSREVGGSELTTVLRNLSSYLRDEASIRSELEARQSWVMNAAKLGIAAPWIILLLLATRPEALAAYNSPGGTVLIVVGFAASAVAYRVMVAISRLPEESRWFA